MESLKLWNLFSLPAQRLLTLYLGEYDFVPTYKKVLSSMIRFEKMYQPLRRGSLYIDWQGYLSEVNAVRRAKRAQIYLLKRDLIQVIDEKKGKRLLVTSSGHRVFFEDYPLSKLRKERWNGFWTVVMYDIPEKERNKRQQLRQILRKLGFGAVQESVFISPLKVEDALQSFLYSRGLSEMVWVMRAQRVLGMENREVAKRAWPLGDLRRVYEELLGVLSAAEKLGATEEWGRYFLAVDVCDPYLPKELLPPDWPGFKCRDTFTKIGRRRFLNTLLTSFRLI